jgi:hypothetical protein
LYPHAYPTTTRPAVNTAEVNISLNWQGWVKVSGKWLEVLDFEDILPSTFRPGNARTCSGAALRCRTRIELRGAEI